MTLRPLISALAVALLATAANAHPAFAVIGGMPGSIPSLVEIGYTSSTGVRLCSGTVVAPNVVLTAAHCADGSAASYAVVTQAELRNIGVSAVITAPGYDASADYVNDAALLVLTSPTLSPFIPLATVEPASVASAAIYGWGNTSTAGGAGLASTTGSMQVLSDATAAAYWGTWWAPSDMAAVDSNGIVALGPGDSGGPLVVGGVEVGINDRCGGGTAPPIFTRVDQLSGWIQTEIAANTPTPSVSAVHIEHDVKTHKVVKKHHKRHRHAKSGRVGGEA